jgi:hypothetical protein
MRSYTALWASVALAATTSCAGSRPPEPAAPKTNDVPVSQLVTSFVVQTCPDAHKMNSQGAETALRRMLSTCDRVLGGGAHFAATLMPGGRIELASAPGEPSEGVVPLCVLKHTLTHPVALARPCTFDVRLEASTARSPGKVEQNSTN